MFNSELCDSFPKISVTEQPEFAKLKTSKPGISSKFALALGGPERYLNARFWSNFPLRELRQKPAQKPNQEP
jgi:hypothetical protein